MNADTWENVSSKLPKVWVVQEGNNDYSSAEEFGNVTFITKGDLRSMECQQNAAIMADVKKFMTDYIAGFDYIIPVGNPMLCCLISMALNAGDHNFLKWDGRRGVYVPYTLNSKMVRK